MTGQGTLILVRHGESSGNADGLFTGLLDVPLTDRGREEASRAAALLASSSLVPKRWFMSPLQRASTTAEIMARHLSGQQPRKFESDWRLAERNYGALTGRRKTDVLIEYGADQYVAWRRSVHDAPPPMTKTQFAMLGDVPAWLGLTEALAAVIRRVASCWHERILPHIHRGHDALVIAHGNSLRALCTVLDDLDDDEVAGLNIPTGHPLIYRFTESGVPRLRGGEYLDAVAAADAAAAIAREGGT